MKTETRSEAFDRVIGKRFTKALLAIGATAAGTAARYQTTAQEVGADLDQLGAALAEVRGLYIAKYGEPDSELAETPKQPESVGEPAPAIPPVSDPDTLVCLRALAQINRDRVPIVVDVIRPELVASFIMHLVARLDDMAAGRASAERGNPRFPAVATVEILDALWGSYWNRDSETEKDCRQAWAQLQALAPAGSERSSIPEAVALAAVDLGATDIERQEPVDDSFPLDGIHRSAAARIALEKDGDN